MKPTIGRIVHYYPDVRTPRKPGHQPNAAIITRINGNGTVNLWAFPTGETVSRSGNGQGIGFGDPEADTTGKLWCWPPREPSASGSDNTGPEAAAAARSAQDGGVDTAESIASDAAATDAVRSTVATDPAAESQALNNGGGDHST